MAKLGSYRHGNEESITSTSHQPNIKFYYLNYHMGAKNFVKWGGKRENKLNCHANVSHNRNGELLKIDAQAPSRDVRAHGTASRSTEIATGIVIVVG